MSVISAAKATYEISLVKVGKFVQAEGAPTQMKTDQTIQMKTDQTIHFVSEDGAILIKLPGGSPFLDARGLELKEITGPKTIGSEVLTAKKVRDAAFELLCYLVLDTGEVIGYDPNSLTPGVNIKVGHGP